LPLHPGDRREIACAGSATLARRTLLGAFALTLALAVIATAGVPFASADTALKPSEYGVSSLCSMPAAGYAGCFGLRLVAREPLSQPGARALDGSASPGEEAG
jgi:hypothetical protein